MKTKSTLLHRACPLLVLFTLLCSLFAGSVAAEQQTISVRFAVAGQSDSGFSFAVEPKTIELESENANVFAALQASGITYEASGDYVTSIEGIASEGADGWQFTVNDTLIFVSSSAKALSDGDVILFIYTKGSNDYLMPTWEAMTGTAPANKQQPDALIGDGTGVTLDADGTLLTLNPAPESISFVSAGVSGSMLSQVYLTKDGDPSVIKDYSMTNIAGTSTNLQLTWTADGIVAAPVDATKPVQIDSFSLYVTQQDFSAVVFRPVSVTYTPQAIPAEISVQFAIAGQDDNGFSFLVQPTSLTITAEQPQTALGALIASGTEYEADNTGYVTSVNGIAAEGMDGWQFHVNDTPVSTPSNKTVLQEGDTVLWVYSKADNGYIMPTWEAMTGTVPANKKQPDALIGDGKTIQLSDSETKLTLDPAPASVTFACASASSNVLAQSWLTPDEPLVLKTFTLDKLSGTDTNLQVTLKDGAFYLAPADTKKAVDVKQFSLQVDGVNYRAAAVSYQPAAVTPTPTPTPTPGRPGGGRPSGSGSGGGGSVVVVPPTATPDASAGGHPAPTPAPAGTEFSQSDWFYAPTVALMEKNIIKGDADTGAVRPNDTINREEIASLLVSAYELPVLTHENDFADSTSSDWALDLLYTLKERGVMNGDGSGMQGLQQATRLDVAVLLARMEGITSADTTILEGFSDAASIPDWARASVAAMVEKGYLSGYEDGTLRLEQSILRCETFALLYRVIQ